MPKRKRRREAPPAPEPLDPLSQFGLLLKASAEREKAEEQRRQRARAEARAAQRAAQQHADDLAAARRQLDEAIEAVRTARRTGRGRADADAAWRTAKASVIELETGAPPAWAASKATGDDSADADDPPTAEPTAEPAG